MGDSKLPRFETETSYGEAMGSKIWSFAQKVVGPLVVAFVLWLVADRNRTWDAIDLVVHDLEIHEIDGRRRHALLDREIEHLGKDMDEMSDELRECQLQQQRILQIISNLPPDKWEDKILANERAIDVIRERMEKR